MTYDEFIQNIISTRGQWNIPNGEYYENHHIMPKCMGGEPKRLYHNQKHENSIWLYPKEHFIAHKLLAEQYKDNYRIVYAWKQMWMINKKQKRYEPLPEDYEQCKLLLQECEKYHHTEEAKKLISLHNKGKHHRAQTEEQRQYLREINTGQLNPNYGKHRTDETKQKISISHKGKKCSEETRKKLSESHKGNTSALGHKVSDETKKILSEKSKGKTLPAEAKQKISTSLIGNTHTKGKKWYNNSIENKMYNPGDQPIGWVEGRLPISQVTQNRLSESKAGKNNPFYGTHYYNNGCIEVRSKECPDGFVVGRLRIEEVIK